ncbi:MAG: GNAT family N-acetyltransferase [Myxococcota bacterium]
MKVAHRGQGIAQGMITTVLHGFEAVGLSTAALSVAPDNHNAIRLYRRLGFERMDGNQ